MLMLARRHWDNRRPHLNGAWQNENVFCLCDACDSVLEEQLKGQFLNELCDCDVPTRWICSKCVRQETEEMREMYAKYTLGETDDFDRWSDLCEVTKNMTDHQFNIVVRELPTRKLLTWI